MGDCMRAVHPRGRLLVIVALLTACLLIAPPQSARADTTFTGATPTSNGTFPFNVALADYNGDGNLDLAVSDQTSASVAILLGNGDGTFTTAPSVSFPLVNSVYAADLNGDGKYDIMDVTSQFIAGGYVTKINVRLGNGDSTFSITAVTTLAFFTTAAAFADLNGDGKIDALLTDTFNAQVRVLLGNGDGTFTPSTIVPSGGANPYDIVLGDWDGDGKRDLAVANSVGGNVGVFRNTGNDSSGNPQFSPAIGSPYVVGDQPTAIAAGILIAGAHPDLVVVRTPATNPTTTPGNLTVLLNNGASGFTVGTSVPTGVLPGGVAIAGLTGSGKSDAVVFNYAATPGGFGSAAVYAGNGLGGFATTAVATIPLGHGVKALAVGDLNRDGKPDIVATNADDNTLTVATNTTTPYAHPTPSIVNTNIVSHPGERVTLNGSGLVAGAGVQLHYHDGTLLAGIAPQVSADGKQITFTLPTTKLGAIIVEVTNPDGEVAFTPSDKRSTWGDIWVAPIPNPLPSPKPSGPPIPGANPLPNTSPSGPPSGGVPNPLPNRRP